MANTPILKKRAGAFSVAVFEETKHGRDGGEYVSRSVVLQKSYKGQDGSWQRQTINMFDNNVAEVAILLQAVCMDLMSVKKESAPETKKEPEAKVDEIDDSLPF